MAIDKYQSQRQPVDIDELRKLDAANVVFLDSRRSRPLWFDGRFAKAADFNRQAEYFLARQADLSVATGTGVIEGLRVDHRSDINVLTIESGFGVTDQGERVVIGKNMEIQLSNIPVIREINTRLGLSRRPKPPLRSSNGVFIVVLRPLEFTANPIASYPTDVDDQRSYHDGDIIEATSVSLIPYTQGAGLSNSSLSRRSEIAHDVFTKQSSIQIPPNSLPLAIIEVRRGTVQWADNFLVRRNMGAAFSDVLGFGLVPRPLRHSHFKQYEEMYQDVIDERRNKNGGMRFSADEYFQSLPSAGQLPSGSLDMDASAQYFFPDNMEVDISVIPEDEIAALVEESLLLPPIDLTASEEVQKSTAVMILVPVPRMQFHSLTRILKKRLELKPLSKNAQLSKIDPRDLLNRIQNKLPDFIPQEVAPAEDLNDVDWRTLIGSHSNLWFVRRRHLSYKEEVVGKVVRVIADEFNDETEMRRYLDSLGLYQTFVNLKVKGSAAADMSMVRLLTIPKFTASELLMRGAIREYQGERQISEQSVNVINDRFSEAHVGEGISKVEAELELNSDQVDLLAKTKKIPELDFIARMLPGESLSSFTDELSTRIGNNQKPATIANFIERTKGSIEQ